MKDQSKFDYSMFKRVDGKYEFRGKVFESEEEVEKHFDDLLNITKRITNSKLGKLIKFILPKKQLPH